MYSIVLALALVEQTIYCDKLAIEIATTEGEFTEVVTPALADAFERLAKRKGYWHATAFYKWEQYSPKWHSDCNIDYTRRAYNSIDKLPPLSEIKNLPPIEYMQEQFAAGSKYYEVLTAWTELGPPWEAENINFLKAEYQIYANIWQAAWYVRNSSGQPFECRLALQHLQDLMNRPVEYIWFVPSFPFWRLKIEK